MQCTRRVLHSGPATKPTTLTVGTNHNQNQADMAANLLGWIQQQEEDARALYGEDIETLPSPLLLEETEEVFGGSRLVLAPPGYKPGRNRSTHPMPCPVASSSHSRRRRHLPATSKTPSAVMSEQREDFLLSIEEKLIRLNAHELQRVCELCKIKGKDNEDIKNKTSGALVKHIIKFCEYDEFLQREDEGMAVLLELNDALEAVKEARSSPSAAVAGAASLSWTTDEEEREMARSELPAAPGEDRSSLERHAAQRATPDGRIQHSRGSESTSNSCCNASQTGFRKYFRINGHVGEPTSKDTLSFSSLEHQIVQGH
ncbi:hypothetical protein CRENBAI_006914 [Crenichthys baileyi]|uniref:Uncharacterized protein n=1 Tax=Crenichthys baileyi TaxID=28760 RepID=A0AAV9S7R5_9TELE